MSYNEILKTVEQKIGMKFPNIVSDIKIRIASGSTGGEITAMVGKYLKDLKINDPEAYSILSVEIEDFLAECRKSGLIII